MQGCTNERSNRVLWAALGLTIYRGEGGGCAPSRVPTPRGAAKRGREGRPLGWALGPSKPRVSPLSSFAAPWALWEAHQPT